jgi:acetyl-CoA acyltransferase
MVVLSMGHPLGCTGAKLSVQLFDEMKRRGSKYGIVTMCVVGTGSAGVYELMQ